MAAVKLLALFAVAACASSAPPPQPAQPPHSHSHHEMRHRFEKADEWAPMFDDPTRAAWQKPGDVVAALGISAGMVIADIGAGTGYFEMHLAVATGREGKVIAVDVEPDMVRYIRERAQREGMQTVEARLGTADDPNLAPGSVDRILIVDTWHHIGDRVAYSKRLAAALRPNGAVFVVDFKLDSDKGPPKEHRLSPEQVIAELQQAGFKAGIVAIGLPDQYMVKASL